jgi:hypothetical protein
MKACGNFIYLTYIKPEFQTRILLNLILLNTLSQQNVDKQTDSSF